LGALMITALWYFTGATAESGAWALAGLWILRIAGSLVALLAAPLLALILVNALFPFLGERAFLGAVRALDPARADALAAAEGMSVGAGIWASIRRLLHFLGLTILAFGLTLIPVLGAVLGPLFQLWSTSRALTWELLDPYFDKRALDYPGQRRYLAEHGAAIAGFGLPLTFVLGLPLIGALFFGLAQAAAALLVVEVLEPAGEGPNNIPLGSG
ncbi:MAG: EI24 domain-containing protein, partial [Myxococcales bacterium]|nr:EI24 domain-containing protein [Myxococcales bacterium]